MCIIIISSKRIKKRKKVKETTNKPAESSLDKENL
jgi:hypothetical protein